MDSEDFSFMFNVVEDKRYCLMCEKDVLNDRKGVKFCSTICRNRYNVKKSRSSEEGRLKNNLASCNYYNKNKSAIKHKRSGQRKHLKWNYGISEEEFNKLVLHQYGKCGICDCTSNLVIDHCHHTMVIRGILCRQCNSGLGMLGDSINGLIKSMLYLNTMPAQQVLYGRKAIKTKVNK